MLAKPASDKPGTNLCPTSILNNLVPSLRCLCQTCKNSNDEIKFVNCLSSTSIFLKSKTVMVYDVNTNKFCV
jgi:hypothetical protein